MLLDSLLTIDELAKLTDLDKAELRRFHLSVKNSSERDTACPETIRARRKKILRKLGYAPGKGTVAAVLGMLLERALTRISAGSPPEVG